MYRLNKTLVYFLILTLASSAFAYNIVVKAYDNLGYTENNYLAE